MCLSSVRKRILLNELWLIWQQHKWSIQKISWKWSKCQMLLGELIIMLICIVLWIETNIVGRRFSLYSCYWIELSQDTCQLSSLKTHNVSMSVHIIIWKSHFTACYFASRCCHKQSSKCCVLPINLPGWNPKTILSNKTNMLLPVINILICSCTYFDNCFEC